MPKYRVDVKAFMSVVIEAEDAKKARAAADLFVENLSPTNAYITGYNSTLTEFGEPHQFEPDETGGFDVDGTSEVERECAVCGTPIDKDQAVCDLCLLDRAAAEPVQ